LWRSFTPVPARSWRKIFIERGSWRQYNPILKIALPTNVTIKMTHHRQQAMGESEQRNFDVMLQFAERSITYDRRTDQQMVACFATFSLGPHFTKHSSVCLVNPAALLWLLYYSQGRLLFNFLDVPLYVFFVALRPNACHGLLILEVSRSHTTTHHSR
jgi:hypothetical protein